MVALSAVFLLLLGPRAGFGAEKLTVKYSWLFTPSIAPVMYGLEKGYYAEAGIDLNLIDGRGSRGNMKLFAAKKLLVGFADSGTAAKFISQGAAAKVIFGYQQTSPLSIIVHSDLGIKDLRGLHGRKIGRAASDSGTALFPALAKRNGVDGSKINFINVSYAARNTALLNRDVDGIIAY
jgi:NitT/TauT family transport system substrate-binding protein